MHMENRRKFNIPMCAALVVLCLVLFSLNMTSGLLARYTTRGTVDGQARAAGFNTLAVGGESNEPITFAQAESEFESENNSYTVKLTNKSETAVRYTIKMVFPEGALDYLSVYHGTDELTPEAGTDTVSYTGPEIAANAEEDVTEEFKFAVDVAKFYEKYSGNDLTTGDVPIDFDTFVKFVQVD